MDSVSVAILKLWTISETFFYVSVMVFVTLVVMTSVTLIVDKIRK